jgi:hypothetical protein
MAFEFKSDQPEQKLVDNKTVLSTSGTTHVKITAEGDVATIVEENLTHDIFAEGEEEQLAIEFLEENGLYTKFLLWCGIKDQLKNLKLSLATPSE